MRVRLPLALLLSACVGQVIEPDSREVSSSADPSTANESGAQGDADEGADDEPTGTRNDGRSATSDPDDDSDATAMSTDPCGPGSESLVESLRIKDVALYQTVKSTLVSNGAWVNDREIPVVQGKEALVRVFAEPMTGYASHAVLAQLTLKNGEQTSRLDARLTPRSASQDPDLQTTFNFTVPASLIGPGTTFSVAIVEEKCDPSRTENLSARFPKKGTQPLEATAFGKLRVVLVPVRIGDSTPDTSEKQVERIREALSAQYPVPEVEVTVTSTLTWTHSVSSNGEGWSELLNEIRKQRQRDDAARDMYYFGLVAPKTSLRSYCSGSCVLGLAPHAVHVNSSDQVGLGIGYLDSNTPTTAVHELGHAHGRGHSPCAPSGGKISGVDKDYPHDGASTGAWGWDARTRALMPPTMKDLMGYCEPAWISDYTYAALADRTLVVNKTDPRTKSRSSESPGLSWHSLILYGDGTARWAGFVTTEAPSGALEPLIVRNANGEVITELQGARVALDHASESFLYIPEPQSDWASIELSGHTIELSSVLPEL